MNGSKIELNQNYVPICGSHSVIRVCIQREIIWVMRYDLTPSSQWRQSEEDLWKFGLQKLYTYFKCNQTCMMALRELGFRSGMNWDADC